MVGRPKRRSKAFWYTYLPPGSSWTILTELQRTAVDVVVQRTAGLLAVVGLDWTVGRWLRDEPEPDGHGVVRIEPATAGPHPDAHGGANCTFDMQAEMRRLIHVRTPTKRTIGCTPRTIRLRV